MKNAFWSYLFAIWKNNSKTSNNIPMHVGHHLHLRGDAWHDDDEAAPNHVISSALGMMHESLRQFLPSNHGNGDTSDDLNSSSSSLPSSTSFFDYENSVDDDAGDLNAIFNAK